MVPLLPEMSNISLDGRCCDLDWRGGKLHLGVVAFDERVTTIVKFKSYRVAVGHPIESEDPFALVKPLLNRAE